MPPNSEVTSIGSHAGGTSRFADPIIAASRYIISGSKEVLDFLCGTKFYIPSEKKYFAIGDECDPPNPETTPAGRVSSHVSTDRPVGRRHGR